MEILLHMSSNLNHQLDLLSISLFDWLKSDLQVSNIAKDFVKVKNSYALMRWDLLRVKETFENTRQHYEF